MGAKSITIDSPRGVNALPALLLRPAIARWLLVLAHGAGAGMQHSFMEAIAARLAEREFATLRYAFPYMAIGRRVPDRPPLLQATVNAAIAAAAAECTDLPLLAGGKSMGGRMTSRACAETRESADWCSSAFHSTPLESRGRSEPITCRTSRPRCSFYKELETNSRTLPVHSPRR